MEKVYIIRKAKEAGTVRDICWEKADKAVIDCYPWDQNGYRPKTEADVVYDAGGLHVLLLSWEKSIMATREKQNDAVYRDSCMEFFFKPNPEKDGRYLNFELNPLGTLTLGLGGDRHDRIRLTEREIFQIRASVTKDNLKNYAGPYWSVQFTIPFEFIEKHFGKLDFRSGTKMTGNFYKCAEDTEYPHHGCWNKIVSKAPDFHRPEYFGDLILE